MDLLARRGEEGTLHIYMVCEELPKEVRGMIKLDWLGVPN